MFFFFPFDFNIFIFNLFSSKVITSLFDYRAVLGGLLGSAVLKDGMPFALHYVMFLPTLMGQGNIEQQAYWIGRAWNCEIMGTYAQV